jgi:hypothetical protein
MGESAGICGRIAAAVMAWPGVERAPHRFGGIEFRLGKRELGHLHGDALVDLPFPRKVRDELVAQGRARPHHVLPDSGWVSFWMESPDDVERAIALFRLAGSAASRQWCVTAPRTSSRLTREAASRRGRTLRSVLHRRAGPTGLVRPRPPARRPCSWSRAVRIVRKPCSISCRTTSRPIPRFAPVTRASRRSSDTGPLVRILGDYVPAAVWDRSGKDPSSWLTDTSATRSAIERPNHTAAEGGGPEQDDGFLRQPTRSLRASSRQVRADGLDRIRPGCAIGSERPPRSTRRPRKRDGSAG